MKRIAIIGAYSAIAEATARLYAEEQAGLFLVGRNAERLQAVASDLTARGATVEWKVLDVRDVSAHAPVVEAMFRSAVDIVIDAHGTLSDQKECEADAGSLVDELSANFVATAALLHRIAEKLQSGSVLCVISSVAGDRGRQSNYVYGAAKGGLSLFLQGLRNRLFERGIQVTTIKPGFVDTPMTAHLKKNPLFVQPETIAVGIRKAIEKRKDVVYLPGFWRPIMALIKLIPEKQFKRMKL